MPTIVSLPPSWAANLTFAGQQIESFSQINVSSTFVVSTCDTVPLSRADRMGTRVQKRKQEICHTLHLHYLPNIRAWRVAGKSPSSSTVDSHSALLSQMHTRTQTRTQTHITSAYSPTFGSCLRALPTATGTTKSLRETTRGCRCYLLSQRRRVGRTGTST